MLFFEFTECSAIEMMAALGISVRTASGHVVLGDEQILLRRTGTFAFGIVKVEVSEDETDQGCDEDEKELHFFKSLCGCRFTGHIMIINKLI